MTRSKAVATAVMGLFAVVLLAAARPGPAVQPAGAPAISPTDSGYSIGFDLGREVRLNLARDGVTVDTDSVVRGFTDGLRAAKPAIPDQQMNKLLAALQKSVDEHQAKERLKNDPVYRAKAEQAEQTSKTFIARFKELKDVKSLPGGAAYQVVKAGNGDSGKGALSVTVNFMTYLSDGELIRQGRGVEISVDELVPGALDLLNEMHVGDRWYAAIPPQLAYGERGNQPRIGPNEALVLDVELLGVKK